MHPLSSRCATACSNPSPTNWARAAEREGRPANLHTMRNLHFLSVSALALASLALAACGPQQSASSQADTSAPGAYAPAAAQLPPSAPIRLASTGVEREP